MSREFEPTEADLAATDAYLDALSRGIDPSDGSDALAAMLLDLRQEVHGDVAAAPVAAVARDHGNGGAQVVDLRSRRVRRAAHSVDDSRRRGRHVGPFVSGLMGAAAATLLIAGGGAAVYNSEPGDALFGMNQALFGDHAAVIELATTLEEANTRNANGDVEGALQLLEQAKAMVADINTKNVEPKKPAEEPRPRATVTETITTTVAPEPAPGEPKSSEAPTPAPASAAPTVTVTVVPAPGNPAFPVDGNGIEVDEGGSPLPTTNIPVPLNPDAEPGVIVNPKTP
ncbi:hypothetical protein [Corynebacterium argentoratense]|uniref:hypothetical protein n=1 Tax=Corynebacterium argentoratense TaxID=42817 RepID=UPI0040423AC0